MRYVLYHHALSLVKEHGVHIAFILVFQEPPLCSRSDPLLNLESNAVRESNSLPSPELDMLFQNQASWSIVTKYEGWNFFAPFLFIIVWEMEVFLPGACGVWFCCQYLSFEIISNYIVWLTVSIAAKAKRAVLFRESKQTRPVANTY